MAEVSLCIPVYNSAPFLGELFDCLTRLDPAPDEILFLDDASSDDSLARIEGFIDQETDGLPVRVLRNPVNSGIAGAYNRLAQAARCEWVQVLDADDLLAGTDFYARVMPYLHNGSDIVMASLASNSRLLHNGARIFAGLVPRRPPLWWPLLGSVATRSGVLYRRERLTAYPFIEPGYPGSDVIQLLQLRAARGCTFVRSARVFYRVHADAESSRVRNYSIYRRELARFGATVRLTHLLDLRLRQLGQRSAR